jgi:hypothetical protein
MTHRSATAFAAALLLPASLLVGASGAQAATPGSVAARSMSPASSIRGHVVLARLGRGTGYGSSARSRYGRSRSNRRASRPYRPRVGHFFGNVLRALGIAYLLHMIFGWGGGGGSPFGLFLVLALIAWVLTRRRRARWTARY